ncbi:hypothetical protein [Dyella caseinilytica]|uniref:Rod shape-determining protein MreD n=1 Tax=Dyella caseinilytica TaxID=1849581 RepID=A0ABX7GVA2_9GAMM|nr:hypothetical protein [Dyella caseinilytica]QRN54347.1 hypothetical protein ISN74_02880 [Dyella caseinilytica]GFZ93462.1 hypothetical protein GCM10011408_11530 [Dyella caseinilytica]
MKPLSRSMSIGLFLLLTLLMVTTRFKHFGDALHLPDASMAVFFLGGLYLRRHLAFVCFVLLAVLLDYVSIHYAGISDFCVTAAYAFLPLAYAALWYGGRLYAGELGSNLRSLLGALVVALACAALSFAISNGSFYWLGGRYAQPHMAEYLQRLWQWGPLFVRTTLSYVAVALLIHLGLSRLANNQNVTRVQA